MRKYLLLLAVMALMATSASATVVSMQSLYFYEKDAAGEFIDGGAKGYMEYRPSGAYFSYWFAAWCPEPGANYTLIYYPGDDPNDGLGLICLGEGTADSRGRFHLWGKLNTGDLPKADDGNYPDGARILLVLSADVDCDPITAHMIEWHPYLYGEQLITYDDTQDTLDLWEKDPTTWDIILGGAQGKLKYDPSAPEFNFQFYGTGLEPRTEYTLIYYPDPWPGNGLICLGNGKADRCGRIIFSGSTETGDLPAAFDYNYLDGAKIWLVLSADVDCVGQMMIGWNPTEYLFENNLIAFNDTDD